MGEELRGYLTGFQMIRVLCISLYWSQLFNTNFPCPSLYLAQLSLLCSRHDIFTSVCIARNIPRVFTMVLCVARLCWMGTLLCLELFLVFCQEKRFSMKLQA